MSNDTESPNVEVNETNNQDNLSTQSGYPNMSSEKTFIVQNGLRVEGDAVVTGSVTATSFIGDGSQLTGISGGSSNGYATKVGYNPSDPSDTTSVVLDAKDGVDPATFRGDIINDSGNVIVDVSSPSATFSGTLLGTVSGNSTTPTGSHTILDVGTDGTDGSLDITDITADGTVDFTGATLIGISAGGGGLDSAATLDLIGFQNTTAGNNSIQVTPDISAQNGDNNNIIIGHGVSDPAGIGANSVALGYDVGAQNSGISLGYQAGAGSQSTNSGGVFIGYQTNYYGNSNPADYAIAIGHGAGAVYPGVGSVALGKSAGAGSSGDYTVAIGYKANDTSSFENTILIKADGSSSYNSTAQYDIDIRTSADGSLTYDTTNDWTFGATVTAPAFVGDGSGLTGLPSGGGLDSAGVLDLLSYGIAEVGSNQKQVAISLNTFVSPTNLMAGDSRGLSLNYTGSTGFSIGEVSGSTLVEADASGSGDTVGIVLKGVTASHTGTEIQGNLRLSSLPTSDPSEVGLLWNDGGIPVFSGSTAPTGGGGLDSAGVQSLIDADLIGSGTNSVAVGLNTVASANSTVAIGYDADALGNQSVAIGENAYAGGTNSVVMGHDAYNGPAGNIAVAVGFNAHADAYSAISIGQNASVTRSEGIAIGASSVGGNAYSIALGSNAKSYGDNSLTIGFGAGNIEGGPGAVLIGTNAGQSAHQRSTAVAIGMNAQLTNDATTAGTVAVGYEAGKTRQESSTVAVGYKAGETDQLNSSIAVGFQAGNTSQGVSSVAIGRDAAFTGQATNSVAIGRSAGYENQGTRSIAIGGQAGASNQGDNNIILNATSAALDRTDQFGIDIRTSAAGSLTYDTTNDWTFGAGVTMTDLTASGATIVLNNLPIIDPVNAGQLWNDGGTLKVSAG